MYRSHRVSIVLLVLGLSLLWTSAAQAKDVAGRFGLGLDNTLSAETLGIGSVDSTPNSKKSPQLGISLKYWINNDWAIAGVIGFMYANAEATIDSDVEDTSGFWAFALDLKGIYNFAKTENANFGLFLTLHIQKQSATLDHPEGPYNSNFGIAVGLGLSPEIFLMDNFAISADLGITVRFQQGFAVGISGDNLLGGMAIHYYF